MKRAKLGLLEVLGLLVIMPGEGDVTALPLFCWGALRKLKLLSWWYLVVRVGRGRMCGGD
jgi:hypothetical protein